MQDDDVPSMVDLEAGEALDLTVEHEKALRREITALKAKIAALENQIANRDHEINLLKEEVAARNHEITGLNRQIMTLNQQIMELNQEFADVRLTVNDIELQLIRWARLTDHYQSAVKSGLADFQARIQELPPDATN